MENAENPLESMVGTVSPDGRATQPEQFTVHDVYSSNRGTSIVPGEDNRFGSEIVSKVVQVVSDSLRIRLKK